MFVCARTHMCMLMQQFQALLTFKNEFKGTLVICIPCGTTFKVLKSPFSTKPRGEALTSLLTNFSLKQ